MGRCSVDWSARSERKPAEKTQTRTTAIDTMRMCATVSRTGRAELHGPVRPLQILCNLSTARPASGNDDLFLERLACGDSREDGRPAIAGVGRIADDLAYGGHFICVHAAAPALAV